MPKKQLHPIQAASQPANKLSEKRVSIQLKGLNSCFLLLNRLISISLFLISLNFPRDVICARVQYFCHSMHFNHIACNIYEIEFDETKRR